ncbi:helix-turn-helix domain-containing protein [Streptomyces sp. NPDC048337]|uniref:helix-turn-helix domain-containing protein n=1 Tax=Streptomyces sp. NPDC048337 TaxID=3365535 RepID=UPI00371CA132
MFEQGVRPPVVVRRLRVSRKSAYAWHEAWREGGTAALASKGAGGFPCRLSDVEAERLRPSWKPARPRTAGARTRGGPWSGSQS